jgi:hypothetical protein
VSAYGGWSHIGIQEGASGCDGGAVGGQSAFVGGGQGYLWQVYAASQPGGLAVVANAQALSEVYYDAPRTNANARASFSSDITFSPTGGTPASLIDVALNVDVSGSLRAWVGGGGTAWVQLIVDVGLNGSGSVGTQTLSCGGDRCQTTSSGMFASATSGQFSTPTVRVPVGRPVNLTVTAYVQADIQYCNATCGAIGAYGQTISLPTSGPVFSLPDGYTVNSASFSIVDNVWVGSPPQIAEALEYLVPEPATAALAVASGIALALPRGRRARIAAESHRTPGRS